MPRNAAHEADLDAATDVLETCARLLDAKGAGTGWDELSRLPLPEDFRRLSQTPQNPVFHGEGDVGAHTRMVCEALLASGDLVPKDRTTAACLVLAALTHDVGKVRTTRLENDAWVSPGHARLGAHIVREHLIRACGLAGTKERMCARELVCSLVRWHMLPPRVAESDDCALTLRRIAAIGELVPSFTWRLLCLLASADALGRVATDVHDILERVELAGLMAQEQGCEDGPYPFFSPSVRRAHLKGRHVAADQPLYDATWGEVTLMCGLPGTGKDTWCSRTCPDLPQVSLDDIRREMRIDDGEQQGVVVQRAWEKARTHLRALEPFVFNATSVDRKTRTRCIDLFEAYGARVRIVYLETSWATLLVRNAEREARVPVKAIERMLARLEPPTPDEAQTVEWLCV